MLRSSHRQAALLVLLTGAAACLDGAAPLGVPPTPRPANPAVYPIGATALVGLAALDLVGDARRDLITVSRGDGAAYVLPGGAAGTFAPPLAVSAGGDPIRATAGDVNGDGIPDLLVIGHLVNAFTLRLGQEDGRFAAPVTYPLSHHGNRLVATDLNGDGYADVVACHDGSGAPISVTAFLGSADGTLHPLPEIATPYFTTEGLAAGDLDGDGIPDVAVAMADNRAAVLVLRGLGTGGFAVPAVLPPATSDSGIGDGTIAIAAGDLNGDGRDDLVVACFGLTNQLVIRLSRDSGFAPPVTLPLPSPVDVAIGDVDGDGRLDAVVANLEHGTVSVLRGRGDGSFDAPVDLPVGAEPTSVAVADFDGDGRSDIAVTSLADHSVRVLLNPLALSGAERKVGISLGARQGGARAGPRRSPDMKPLSAFLRERSAAAPWPFARSSRHGLPAASSTASCSRCCSWRYELLGGGTPISEPSSRSEEADETRIMSGNSKALTG